VSSSLRGSASPLTEAHDVALLDLDGVVYVGPDVVPGAAEALASARERGMRLAFVTNNAARPPHEVADHLNELGVAAKVSEIVTSAQAAARYLADRLPGSARVLVVGTRGLTEALRERGLVPVEDARAQVDAVVQGYSPELTWAQLAEGAVAINRGVMWVATNTDRTIPSARGPLPGNGAFVVALQHATGRDPLVTGKPDPTMHRESLIRSEAERPIVVGDRLDTDIEGANAVGCASLLVFSGVTTPRELLGARPALRPTYVAPDVAGLLVAHPQPQEDGDGWTCGRWRAHRRGGELQLASLEGPGTADSSGAADQDRAAPGSGAAMDALRALCTAWWSADEEQTDGASGAGEPRLRADDDDARRMLEAVELDPAER
jgi:HAD superfamily hydrolase (TIGR01450 family)